MPSTEMRQICSVSFQPDSLAGSSVGSRGSSEEKQLDDDSRKTSTSSKASTSSLSWAKSKKIEDELSQLWDTGQVEESRRRGFDWLQIKDSRWLKGYLHETRLSFRATSHNTIRNNPIVVARRLATLGDMKFVFRVCK
jgi:hypothetical protein